MSIDIELPYPKESETTPPVLESPKICPPLIEGSGVLSPHLRGVRSVLQFYFDASTIENKKANEKSDLVYELKEIKENKNNCI